MIFLITDSIEKYTEIINLIILLALMAPVVKGIRRKQTIDDQEKVIVVKEELLEARTQERDDCKAKCVELGGRLDEIEKRAHHAEAKYEQQKEMIEKYTAPALAKAFGEVTKTQGEMVAAVQANGELLINNTAEIAKMNEALEKLFARIGR
jgi:hypothetical protein